MDLHKAQTYHPRNFSKFDYVYPVISRRSKGVSLGINLSRDKACNFSCSYCHVDRSSKEPFSTNDIDVICSEVHARLHQIDKSGVCCFLICKQVPPGEKILRDVAISGEW